MYFKRKIFSMNNKLLIFLLLLIFLILTNCIVVKEKDEIIKKEIEIEYKPSTKFNIKMSDQIIRSELGDMVVSVPDGWFFIETHDRVSSDIFAVVSNPTYTISAIFSHIKPISELAKIVEQEGTIGLARMIFAKRSTKSSNNIVLVDSYNNYSVNNHTFTIFNYLKIKDNTLCQTAVFISEIGEFYEFSLATMNFTNNEMLSRTEFDDIFYSILSTLKY